MCDCVCTSLCTCGRRECVRGALSVRAGGAACKHLPGREPRQQATSMDPNQRKTLEARHAVAERGHGGWGGTGRDFPGPCLLNTRQPFVGLASSAPKPNGHVLGQVRQIPAKLGKEVCKWAPEAPVVSKHTRGTKKEALPFKPGSVI